MLPAHCLVCKHYPVCSCNTYNAGRMIGHVIGTGREARNRVRKEGSQSSEITDECKMGYFEIPLNKRQIHF
jgi:hypothetical protein